VGSTKPKVSKISKVIRNVHKISNLVNFCGTKTLKETLENPNWNPRGVNSNSIYFWTKVQILK
jgi:hypothetical protein